MSIKIKLFLGPGGVYKRGLIIYNRGGCVMAFVLLIRNH